MGEDAVARRSDMHTWSDAETNENSVVIIDHVDEQQRRFIIQPPLKLRARWIEDAFYVADERLNLQARGETLPAVRQALCRAIPEVWDRYAQPSLTPADDGFKVGKALRRRIRVENRQA